MSALIIMLAFYMFDILLMAFALRLAAKLFKYSAPTFARSLAISAILFLLSPLLSIPLLFIPEAAQLPYSIFGMLIQIFFAWFLIKRIHRTTAGRAWAGFGFYAASLIVVICIGLFFIRSTLVEAYRVPTLAMAPTMVSEHRVMICPNCGGELLVDVPDRDRRRLYPPPTVNGFCINCRRNIDIPTSSLTGPTENADRFFVTKFLSPSRWDIIVFHHDADVILKRIIAFPSETVAINDQGQILINGTSIGSPPDNPKLTFPWPDKKRWNYFRDAALTPETSLDLGPDEYFVIGDNATHSYDSRFFGPIHTADIIGVTSMIYWPLNRIRIIR